MKAAKYPALVVVTELCATASGADNLSGEHTCVKVEQESAAINVTQAFMIDTFSVFEESSQVRIRQIL